MIEAGHAARDTVREILNIDYEIIQEIIENTENDFYDLDEPENDAFWRSTEDSYLAAVYLELGDVIARRKRD